MTSRLTPLWILLAVLCGYALPGATAKAAADNSASIVRLPVNVARGAKVTLIFARGTMEEGTRSLSCTVAETSDSWVRCAGDEFAARGPQRWYDLKRVVEVQKPE